MNIGQSYTSAGHGVIMISTFPLWASVFSHIFIPKDKLNKKRLIGMIIAYLGIVILFWDSIFGTINDYLFGDLLMLCSALLLGARQIYISQISSPQSSTQITSKICRFWMTKKRPKVGQIGVSVYKEISKIIFTDKYLGERWINWYPPYSYLQIVPKQVRVNVNFREHCFYDISFYIIFG